MSEAARGRMTAAAFLDWVQQQEARYELVDGVPMMMAGAKRRHGRVVTNVLGLLRAQLTGRTCEPFNNDTAVRTPQGNIRYPDAGVDCGEDDDDELVAGQPRLVVEVLSPSTRDFDMSGKLDEYQSIAALRYVLLIDPDAPEATLWSRLDATSWTGATVMGLEHSIAMPELGLVLPMADIYARVTVQARPRLVT